MSAVTDPDYSQRNNHYIFTEDYQLGAAYASGANITRANYQPPTWNAIGRFNIWPVNKSADIPSPPQMDWWMNQGPMIPRNEEFQIKVTDSASETPDVLVWLLPKTWNANLPAGSLIINVRVTATVTIVAHNWSAIGALTFEQSLRGGVYAVVGAAWQGTHLMCVRLVFPRATLYNGRKMRPGVLAQNAIGDLLDSRMHNNPFIWGEHGRFHTFEPPQIDIYGNTAGSTSIEGRLWLVYLGSGDPSSLMAG